MLGARADIQCASGDTFNRHQHLFQRDKDNFTVYMPEPITDEKALVDYKQDNVMYENNVKLSSSNIIAYFKKDADYEALSSIERAKVENVLDRLCVPNKHELVQLWCELFGTMEMDENKLIPFIKYMTTTHTHSKTSLIAHKDIVHCGVKQQFTCQLCELLFRRIFPTHLHCPPLNGEPFDPKLISDEILLEVVRAQPAEGDVMFNTAMGKPISMYIRERQDAKRVRGNIITFLGYMSIPYTQKNKKYIIDQEKLKS